LLIIYILLANCHVGVSKVSKLLNGRSYSGRTEMLSTVTPVSP
jgi:hypothetical protein